VAIPGPHLLLKRVLAMPGECLEVKISLGGIFENVPALAGLSIKTVYVVPEDCVYLMGDNTEHSTDSREFGPVPIDCVHGIPLLKWRDLDWIPF